MKLKLLDRTRARPSYSGSTLTQATGGMCFAENPKGKNHTVLLEVFRVEPSPTR
jgi:hypothetical protein